MGLRFSLGDNLDAEASYQLIREKVKKAIVRIKDFKPHKLSPPIQLDVRFKNYRPSEVLSYLSIVERTDAHSIDSQARTSSRYQNSWNSL
jgi:D-aminopeptidase